MAAELESWLKSGKYAQLNGQQFRPIEYPKRPGKPLIVERGQASALFLQSRSGEKWIVKKFRPGLCPETAYLQAIGQVLPTHPGFRAGTGRRLLSSSDLRRTNGCYYRLELKRWLENTVLMPRVSGMAWNILADRLRDGKVLMTRGGRLRWCQQLSELVRLLETHGCAHRDLSGSNVFLDEPNRQVLLIDFDCVYHPNLARPMATTCGTNGYIAPFVWVAGKPDSSMTWRQHSDRFALAVLHAEFLTTGKSSPSAGDGGLLEQKELCARSGGTLSLVIDKLRSQWPEALPLFLRAINARNFGECPSPGDWLGFCSQHTSFRPPSLSTFKNVDTNRFELLLQRRRSTTPCWPAPQLDELPQVTLNLRRAVTQKNSQKIPKSGRCNCLVKLSNWLFW